ncbi:MULTISPECIES: hypothetical protein [Streptococcus]|jgi:hypothetical protein|uniref:hypothetical protein n=1 Tax=Streptococcus TaxID=1301 RepID=UPI00065F7C2E|nr:MULTISPECIES: hypothetical protein [Streptococcus]MDU4411414.1 hypothetical protein [Streptococcus sp.]
MQEVEKSNEHVGDIEKKSSRLLKALVEKDKNLVLRGTLSYSDKITLRNELYSLALEIYKKVHDTSKSNIFLESDPNIVLETSQLILAIVYPERFNNSDVRSITFDANVRRISNMVQNVIMLHQVNDNNR